MNGVDIAVVIIVILLVLLVIFFRFIFPRLMHLRVTKKKGKNTDACSKCH